MLKTTAYQLEFARVPVGDKVAGMPSKYAGHVQEGPNLPSLHAGGSEWSRGAAVGPRASRRVPGLWQPVGRTGAYDHPVKGLVFHESG